MIFTVKDVPQLPYRTSNGLVLRAGNKVDTDDYPDLLDDEVDAIYRAGFIEIEGRDPSPDTDSNRRVLIKPDRIKVGING